MIKQTLLSLSTSQLDCNTVNMQGFQNNNEQYFIAKFTVRGMWAYHLALNDCPDIHV